MPFLVLFFWMWFSSASAQDCKPVITTPNGTSLCDNSTIKLEASEAQTYTWSTGATTRSINVDKPGDYWVKTITSDGCEATSETLTIAGAPNASIADPEYPELNFTYCSYSSSSTKFKFTLNIENTSTTKATNREYIINWGDGQTSTYGKSFDRTTHTYTAGGGYDIVVTVIGENGCTSTTTQRMFIGSNPGLGISSDGNNTQCAPATYRFKITGVDGNSPETVYTFQFDDGSPAITYKHNELPADRYIYHTFTESSKDTEFGFTLSGYAKNPCSSSRATFSGIRISKGPEADFGVGKGEALCVNVPVNLQNLTKSGYDATNNTETYQSEWTIEPATGWHFVSGSYTSKSPKLVFTEPGKYKLNLTTKSLDPNLSCGSSSKEQEIYVNAPPKADFTLLPGAADNCTPTVFKTQNLSEGDNVAYNWEVSPAEGWNFANGTSATSENAEFNFTVAGDYTIKLVATNECAPASIKEEKVTIRNKPVVTLPANAVYCGPQTIAFTSENEAHSPVFDAQSGTISGYRWTVTGDNPATFTSGNSSSANPTIAFEKAGLYTVSIVALNECGASEPAIQQIRIDALPELQASIASPEICLGSSTTITVSGADTYTWAPAEGLNTTTGSEVIATPTKTTTYTITGTNSETGCSSTTTVTIIVNEPPKVTVTTDIAEICVGQGQAILSASGADRYEWAPASGLSATTGANVTATPSETTTYTVTGFDDKTGCSTTTEVTINVNPLPEVSAGPDITVCNQPVATKLQGSPAGGKWSGEHVTADGTFTPPTETGVYTLTYTFTNQNGCTNYSTMQVTVNEAPVADAGQDMTVCLNSGSFDLQANLEGGKWNGSELLTEEGTFTPSKAGTYILTYTYGEGSCKTTDQVSITVNELPQAPTVLAVAPLCPGFGTTLQVKAPVGNIAWYDAATGGTLLGNGPVFETPALDVTTTYYVETTIEGGCTSVRTPVKVTVRPATPAPTVAPVTLCGPGSGATLVAQGNATVYQWFDAAEEGNLVHTGRSFGIASVSESKTYYVQAVIEGCISPRTAATITVLDVITDNTITEVAEICAGQTPAMLVGSTPTGGDNNYTYYWESSTKSATEGFSKVEGATAKDLQPGKLTASTWFRRVAVSSVCSHVSEPVKVSVTPVISNNTISEDATYCIGTEAETLNGSQPTGGTKTYTYLWESSTTGENGSYTKATGTNTEANYNPGVLTETTWFRRTAQSGTCQLNVSQPVKITIYKPISNNTIAGEQIVCENAIPQVLTGSQPENGNGEYVYKWFMSTDGENFTLASGQNNGINYAVGALTRTTWFKREVSGGPCGPDVSNTIKIHVNPTITGNIISSDQVICYGTEAAILKGNAPAGGDGTYTFRWMASTTGADGAYEPAAGINNTANYTPGKPEVTTWYKREVLSGTCVDVSPAIEVTVVPLPTAPAVAAVTICEGSKATLTVTAAGNYNWYTSMEEVTPIFSGRSFETPTLNETITYYVETVNANGCGSPVRTAVIVTVNKNISNNSLVAPTAPICAGQVPNLLTGTTPEGGNALGYTFRWEKKTEGIDANYKTITGATEATYQPQALEKTTWFRRVVISGPCFENVSEPVKVDVLPALANNKVTAVDAVCEGEAPAILTGSEPTGGNGNYTYTWYFSENGTMFTEIPNSNSRDYQPGALNTTTWFKRAITSGPCARIDSEVVKIIVHPTIVSNTISPTETVVCENGKPGIINGSKHAGGISAYTYLWEVSTDGVTYTDAPGVNSNQSYQPAVLTAPTWFRRKVTSGKCFDHSAPVKIDVNPLISDNTITDAQMVCVGSAPALLQGSTPTGGNGNYTYQWQYATTNSPEAFYPVPGNSNSVNYQPVVLSTTTYYRRVVTSGACSQPSNVVKITVSPEISRNTIAIDQTIYAGQRPAPINGSLPTGGDYTYTYLWEMSTDGENYITAAGLNDGKNFAPPALSEDTWYRRRVFSGGCDHVSDPVKITITPAISNNNIQADQVICFGNTPNKLSGSQPEGGEGNYQYQWQYKTGDTWLTAKGESKTRDYMPPALTQDTWFRRVVISGERSDASPEVMITVKPAMSNNKVSTNQTICYATAPSTLQGTMPSGGSGKYTYLWEYSTAGPDKGFTTAPGANNGQNYNPMPLTQKTWFRRVVTSESCEALLSNAIVVSINAQPEAPVAKGMTICSGSSVTLSATGKEGRLEWYASASSGALLTTGNTFTTPVLTHTTTYYVQEVALSCASERTPVTVTVMEPSADAGPDKTIIKGRSIPLQASGGDTYSWSPAIGLSDPNIANPVATPESTITYTVTIKTAGGCVFTDEVTITVLPFVDIPNTFTPNRDGINDTWEIKHLEKYPNSKVQVFNQWGNMVFSSTGYKAPWDGRHNGKELPIATYYYIIQLEPSEKPLSGSITIVK